MPCEIAIYSLSTAIRFGAPCDCIMRTKVQTHKLSPFNSCATSYTRIPRTRYLYLCINPVQKLIYNLWTRSRFIPLFRPTHPALYRSTKSFEDRVISNDYFHRTSTLVSFEFPFLHLLFTVYFFYSQHQLIFYHQNFIKKLVLQSSAQFFVRGEIRTTYF